MTYHLTPPQVFSPAMASMNWIRSVARAISHQARAPVEWTTPLGLPVLQPYHHEVQIYTHMHACRETERERERERGS